MSVSTVSAAGMRIVRLLVGNPPQTVSDLIATTGVTRTAVTEQLNELVAGGFVERTVERLPGRGRPRHLYQATTAALLLLFASNQKSIVPAIWQAIDEVGGAELAERVLRRVSALVAEQYKRRITSVAPKDRLKELARLLADEGGLVEVDEEAGALILRKRSCAFISMFEPKRSVCRVDEDLLSSVVGRPVRRVACRHDGDPCCSFELLTNGRS